MLFLSQFALGLAASIMMTQEVAGTILDFTWDRPGLAMPLPQDLCGFSIEADRFPDWAGSVSKKNNFTYTLLNNLKEKTGVPPHIRVGGGSQDHLISTPNVTDEPGFYNVFDPVPEVPEDTKSLFPQAFFTGAGLDYWRCAGNMPKGTKFTWGVNFLAGNASEAVAQVRQLEKAFADPHCRDVHLHAIELGNEVDTFVDGERRPKDWSIWDYKAEQSEYFNAINKALGRNGRKYRTGDWAIEWTTAELLSTGIIQSPMGRSINAVSEHHYQGASDLSMVSPSLWPSIATDLVHKDYVRGNVSRYTMSALTAKKSGIDFVLGETGSYFGHGQPGVSNSAAAALWMINYSLQAACHGISELHFHQGVGYNYSAFVPVDNIGRNITDFDPDATRHVMPLYYGYLVVADAIGTSGNTHINEIWTDTNEIWTAKSHLTAYQIWEEDELKRLMLIDSIPWTEASTGDRPLRTLTLPELAGRAGVKVKTLEFSSLSALGGLKWGGQSWETSTGLPTGKETFGTIDTNGTLTMNASSAALIYL